MKDLSVNDIANMICGQLPEKCEINLCMEEGSAYVTLAIDGDYVDLPDSADKTICEQLLDAIRVANKSFD